VPARRTVTEEPGKQHQMRTLGGLGGPGGAGLVGRTGLGGRVRIRRSGGEAGLTVQRGGGRTQEVFGLSLKLGGARLRENDLMKCFQEPGKVMVGALDSRARRHPKSSEPKPAWLASWSLATQPNNPVSRAAH
jgi:hypothetical protein